MNLYQKNNNAYYEQGYKDGVENTLKELRDINLKNKLDFLRESIDKEIELEINYPNW